jgi:uncharacterized protein YeaO (DUF488 family)
MRVARVYDEPDPEDGVRVLIDRLWPRGMRKNDPRIGRWYKQVSPSTELRRWYGHEPTRFDEFKARYEAELDDEEPAAALDELRELARTQTITLVTAAKDLDGSHVTVLASLLDR